MALRAKTTVDTTGLVLFGSGIFKDDLTLLQDATRAADLEQYTVLAQQASTLKWVPLTDVDPALTPGYMTTGAITGTAADFQAVADGEFRISVDGQVIDIAGLDFSGIDAATDTAGFYTCGANGAIIAAGWDAVADGEFAVTINGEDVDVIGLDFTGVTTFQEVADIITLGLAGRGVCVHDAVGDIFTIISSEKGADSTVSVLAAVAGGAGTDISGAGYLNGAAAGAPTAGTGGLGMFQSIAGTINAAAAGRFFVEFNGTNFVFSSPTAGAKSSVSVLSAVAPAVGTDISGAGYLEGTVELGAVATAGTGGDGENIPAGIYVGSDVAFADLVAGDVTNRKVLVGGDMLQLDEDKIVLENSLDLDDVVFETQKTIRQHLEALGFYTRDTYVSSQVAPI